MVIELSECPQSESVPTVPNKLYQRQEYTDNHNDNCNWNPWRTPIQQTRIHYMVLCIKGEVYGGEDDIDSAVNGRVDDM